LALPSSAIRPFSTYEGAAAAVLHGDVDAYASVAQAHRGYLQQHPDLPLAVVSVPAEEKSAEVGAYAFAPSNAALAKAIDRALAPLLGTPEHRALLTQFGLPTS
ncbi:MAG TPA: transporter substrate-binding domain-containing protein, partial [Kiloniellales bacterium]|nr:transporter substrate-binding domain-containing protein [Kiloniellales bacterium]